MNVDPLVIDDEGGTEIVISGTFPLGEALGVYLGKLASDADPPCYGGQGFGFRPMSLDGTTIRCIAPPAEIGENTVTVIHGETIDSAPVMVVERNFKHKAFDLRADFPPWYGVGPRAIDQLPPVGEL